MAANDKPGRRDAPGGEPASPSRWWVDQGKPREGTAPPLQAQNVAGASFFRIAVGYEQEAARANLTDLNLRLLQEGNPPPNGWAHLQMTPDRFSAGTLEQIKRAVRLPPGARAVAVDSGVSLRVILTGEPPGERVLELRFGEESSFDAWVGGEWVSEALFQSLPEALKAAPGFIDHHLAGSADR